MKTLTLFLTLMIMNIMLPANHTENGFLIQGSLEGVEDGTEINLFSLVTQTTLASATIQSGKFKLSGRVERPSTCWLRCKKEYSIVQVENVAMTYRAHIDGMLFAYEAIGGYEQSLYNDLRGRQKEYDQVWLRASERLMEKDYKDEKEKQKIFQAYKTASKTSMNIYREFGVLHPHTYLGLDILYSNRKEFPRETLENIYQDLPDHLLSTKEAKGLKIYLYDALAQIGQMYQDFEARDLAGNPFTLSSLQGNYIFLTFWGAGCGPCRMENRYLNENMDRVPKDLSIVSFAVMQKYAAWKKASELDGITWYNVSDMAGASGHIKTQYNVQGIPTSFLIDPEGIIFHRFTGFGTQNDLLKKIEGAIQAHEQGKAKR